MKLKTIRDAKGALLATQEISNDDIQGEVVEEDGEKLHQEKVDGVSHTYVQDLSGFYKKSK